MNSDTLPRPEPRPRDFQDGVERWMIACFGPVIAADRVERNHRFLEEALELVQSLGCTASEAHQLVEYVYGRPAGDPWQEVGGVLVTLAALCGAAHLVMDAAGEAELNRIWTKVDQIRAKQALKPRHSPLPAALTISPAQTAPAAGLERVRHLKRGTEYEVLGEAEMQISMGSPALPHGPRGPTCFVSEGDCITVYRNPKTGKLWGRFPDEFRDGRFETISGADPTKDDRS